MKSQSGIEATGPQQPEEPTIKALPTPTEEDRLRDHIAQLIAANAGLGEKLTDATTRLSSVRELQERTSHTLADTKVELATTAGNLAEKTAEANQLTETVRELNAAVDTRTTERDDALAQWEEWSTHPFFSAILQLTRQSSGTPVSEELSEKMKELVNAVADTGKGGTVSLVLGAKPLEGQHQAMVIGAKVTSKLPKGDPDTAIVFMTDKGTMTSEDPKQKRLPLSGDKKMKPKVNPVVELEKAKAAKVTEIPAKEFGELTTEEEEIYEAAAAIAAQEKVTKAIIQKRLRLGYTTAAKIFAALDARGAFSK